jgi:hypothetical protein
LLRKKPPTNPNRRSRELEVTAAGRKFQEPELETAPIEGTPDAVFAVLFSVQTHS